MIAVGAYGNCLSRFVLLLMLLGKLPFGKLGPFMRRDKRGDRREKIMMMTLYGGVKEK